MANAYYIQGITDFTNGDIDWTNDTFRAYLVDTGTYTFSAAHQDVADLSGIVATATLSSTAVLASGAADSADAVFTSVTGSSIEAIVVARWSGTSSTSTLICYIDTATGLPVTPNGGNITVVVAATGWFKLGS